LIGPDYQSYAPLDQLGSHYIFEVTPQFVEGDYALRFTQANQTIDTPWLLTVQTQTRSFTEEPLSTPIQANFANQLQLRGYNLSQLTIQTKDSIIIMLQW